MLLSENKHTSISPLDVSSVRTQATMSDILISIRESRERLDLRPVLYIDSKYVKADVKQLDIFTPGRVKYHGVFETMLVQGKKVDDLDAHVMRLLKGLKVIKIKSPSKLAGFKAIIHQVVKKNALSKEGRLRLMVFKTGTQVHCLCMLLPYKPYTESQYKKGLKATLIKTNRPANRRYANVKSLDYACFADALAQAQHLGYDEAILVNKAGHIFETTRGNIFILHHNQWFTPPLSSGCLNGITRQRVIDLSKKMGLLIQEKPITPKMLKNTTSMFMSNSLLGLIRINLKTQTKKALSKK